MRPPGYEPDELPTALPRDIVVQIYSFFDTSQVHWCFYFFLLKKCAKNSRKLTKKKENQKNDSPYWLRGHDSNVRPPGYEPDELPTALPRDAKIQLLLYHTSL